MAPLPLPPPATSTPIRAGIARRTSWTGWTSSIRTLEPRHGSSAGGGSGARSALTSRRPGVACGALGEVVDEASATSRSRPSISAAPAADAVVTVTLVRPKQLLERAALGVDGLDARERGDPALLVEPARLGVDGVRSPISQRCTR